MHATVSPSMTSRRSPLRHTPLVLALAACLCGAPLAAHAQVSASQLPTGGSIAGGTGTINAPNGASLTITQTSNRMALTWGSFDIGSGATVTFNQPSSSAVSLNQIQGGNPTQIYGNLNANGQVFLINTNGMIFGSTANINVGGLVASTLGTDASTFMSGSNVLDAGGNTVALMSNTGTINASAGGVSLIGGKVTNGGTITAAAGNLNLVGADRVVLVFESGGFGVTVEKPLQLPLDAVAVENSGNLLAAGGQVRLEARSLPGLFSQLINNSSVISAAGIAGGTDGSVMLIAGGGSSSGTAIGGGGSINVGIGSLGYVADGGVQQSGVLTTGALSLGVGGNAAFTGSNKIAQVGGDVGGSLNLQNARNLGQSAGLTVGGSALFATIYTLALDNADNDFAGPVRIIAQDATLRDRNALTLGTQSVGSLTVRSGGALNLGNGVINGALSATSDAGGITQTNALSVAGAASIDAGAGAITLAHENDFSGSLALAGRGITVVDTNDLTVSSVNNAGVGDINLTARGSLTMPAGAISTNGALLLSADGGALTLGGALTGNAVSLYSRTALNLGTSITAAGALAVVTGDSALTQTAGALSVGGTSVFSTDTGAISLGAAGNHFGGPVNLFGGSTLIRDVGALTLGTLATGALTAVSNGVLSLGTGTVAGALSATSNGHAVTQSGALVVNQASSITAGTGSISLSNTGNDFRAGLALDGGNITVNDRDNLIITSLVGTGNRNIVLTAGGQLTLPSQAIDAGTGNIRLASTGGSLSTAGALRGNQVTLSASSGLFLNQNIGANTLALDSADAPILQSAGALTVQGAATVDAGAGSVSLQGGNNDFSTLSLRGNGINVTDRNNLTIASLISDGNSAITLTALGNLTLPAQTMSTGLSDLAIAAGGTLGLNGALSGRNVTLYANDSVSVAHDVTASQALFLQSDGAITQTGGAIRVGTTAGVTAAGDVTLDGSGNRFGTGLALIGSNLSVTDSGDLTLLNVGVGPNGNVALTAGGALFLPGQTIDAGTGTIDLVARGGALTTHGELRGRAISMTVRDGIVLADDVTATDTLALTTRDAAITQTAGALTAGGWTHVDAGTGNITLGNAANVLAGPVNLAGADVRIAATALSLGTVSANALTATSGGALNLGSSTVRGALSATSGNAAITQSGALSVDATATFTAGSGAITLTDAGNAFAGAVSLNGGDAVVRTGAALRLGNSQLTSLQVSTAGDLSVDGRVSATAIDLSTGGVFRNTRGADALSATGGRWLVRLLDPNGGHVFNGLDSGNTALWSVGAADAVSQAGNRYAFAYQPVLTVSSSNAGKVYGTVADLATRWTATGLMEGVVGAYTSDSLAQVLNGAPELSSLGAAATAGVAGGPYRITTGLGTLTTGGTGYALATADSGLLTVTPASLVIQAGNAGKIYGSTANLAGFTSRGLVNGDTVTAAELASAGQAGSAGVGSYAITASNASGAGLSNYDIAYVAGRLTVDPATLRVIARDTTRAPDGPALLAYYTEGLFNADTVTSAILSSEGTSSLANPGAYAIGVSGAVGTGLSNYRIEYVPGTLLVSGFNPGLIATAVQSISALQTSTRSPWASAAATTMTLDAPPSTPSWSTAPHNAPALEMPTANAPATCLVDNVLGQCRLD
ncbi:filamentous hemagglutinin N-terminal domain-containing protein [Stenotrophomonas sp.]|uniref:beta strand repeat-containing protein n=1 Tax=Stenotrophomonas sp. TaxID=69392 RepID=UPI0028AAC753|nr:filamentous hemagglutinin N-terminal domain-containing protein [Stenotrophomonas sp.]